MNGDLGQRSTSVLNGMVDYYRYSGDPAAIAHLTYMGDYLLDHTLTRANHLWPKFPISVPTKGVLYRKADPHGMIQLDICADRGRGLLRWTADDTWACYFWEWRNPVQNCSTTADVASYLIANQKRFPNWRNDARNILTEFLMHSSANPGSSGDVYNGAWAYPESISIKNSISGHSTQEEGWQ